MGPPANRVVAFHYGDGPAVLPGRLQGPMELVGKPVGKARELMENLTEEKKQELRGVLKTMGAPVVG